MRILIIEDELTLAAQLSQHFRNAGYAVDCANTGTEGKYLGSENPYDVAIIDLGLPDISGLQVITHLRLHSRQFPILILTAKSRWQEKVEGLESGADDYLVKPFHLEELDARVRALVRRASGVTQSTLQCGPITVNIATQKVLVNDTAIDLTSYEYRLLEYLMLHKEQVVSKSDITEHIYDQDFDRDSNVIEVFVGRLRRKIDPTDTIKPIETVRGRGYRFALECN